MLVLFNFLTLTF